MLLKCCICTIAGAKLQIFWHLAKIFLIKSCSPQPLFVLLLLNWGKRRRYQHASSQNKAASMSGLCVYYTFIPKHSLTLSIVVYLAPVPLYISRKSSQYFINASKTTCASVSFFVCKAITQSDSTYGLFSL